MTSISNTLTIAGSDPSGGAGIQTDLKTFSALGCFGTSVITALTAQNTQGVQGVQSVPTDFIAAQLSAVLDDIEIGAVKIGMVANRDVAEVIAEALRARRPRWVVLDPVMAAKSGDILVDPAGIAAVRDILVPMADVITPNLPEIAVLLDAPTPDSTQAMQAIVPTVQALNVPFTLLKGGHLRGADCPDLLITPQDFTWLDAARIDTNNLHGTGCALAAAITAQLAQLPSNASQQAIANAIAEAKQWLHAALAASHRLSVGQGRGPVHHFHAWW